MRFYIPAIHTTWLIIRRLQFLAYQVVLFLTFHYKTSTFEGEFSKMSNLNLNINLNLHPNSNYTLITGASSGIGYALAKVFASNNHNLILVARSTDKLSELKKALQLDYKIQVEIFSTDLSVPGSAENLFNQIQQGKFNVDTLVNNAGVGAYGVFSDVSLKTTHQMLHLNIISLTELTKLFLPYMLSGKSGKILNVASTAGFQPGPLMSVYFATKAFVLHFSEGLFEELKNTGVTVTALCPGPTESNFISVAKVEDISVFKALKLPTSKMVAEFGYASMMKGQAVAIHGLKNKFLSFAVRFTPRSIVRKLVMKILK